MRQTDCVNNFTYHIHDAPMWAITNLQWHQVIRNKGNLEVSANQLAPQIILACVCCNALSYKIYFIHHNFT